MMNDAVHIRKARPGDAGQIAAINAEGVPGVTAMAAPEAARIIDAATLFVVAEVKGVVAGYLMGYEPGADYDGEEFLWFRSRGDDFFYVDQIAVSASARGAGVGRALYDEAARAAAGLKLAAIVCEVNLDPPNPQSMAFHARLGFTEMGRLQVRRGDRFVALLSKPL